MITRILGRLAEGTTTMGALAAELGMGRERLDRMLEMLVRLGYLEQVRCDADGGATALPCPGCTHSHECEAAADGAKGKAVGKGIGVGVGTTYVLTERGRRASGKSMRPEGHGGPTEVPAPRQGNGGAR